MIEKTFIRAGRVCVFLISAVALSACGSTYQTLLIGDRALLPSARVSRSLYRADRTLSPSEVQTELAVEGGLLGGSGSSPTYLYAQALIGNQIFNAPQTIDTDFDFKAADVSLHWRHALIKRHIGYDFFGGVGLADFNFQASSPTAQASESISSPALRLGAGAFWRVFGATSLEVEGTLLKGNHEFTFLGGHRFSLVQKLGKHVTVNGGWVSWHIETSNSTRSRIELHIQGPAAGVNVKF